MRSRQTRGFDSLQVHANNGKQHEETDMLNHYRYELKTQSDLDGTIRQEITVAATDLNVGFAKAAIEALAALPQHHELVSLTFWAAESELDVVKRFVHEHWDGVYSTKFGGTRQDNGARFYETRLHGPDGDVVWTRVDRATGELTDATRR